MLAKFRRLFVHVYGLPEKPKSTSPCWFTRVLKPLDEEDEKGLPSFLSTCSRTSLKSPMHSQGPEKEEVV